MDAYEIAASVAAMFAIGSILGYVMGVQNRPNNTVKNDHITKE